MNPNVEAIIILISIHLQNTHQLSRGKLETELDPGLQSLTNRSFTTELHWRVRDVWAGIDHGTSDWPGEQHQHHRPDRELAKTEQSDQSIIHWGCSERRLSSFCCVLIIYIFFIVSFREQYYCFIRVKLVSCWHIQTFFVSLHQHKLIKTCN